MSIEANCITASRIFYSKLNFSINHTSTIQKALYLFWNIFTINQGTKSKNPPPPPTNTPPNYAIHLPRSVPTVASTKHTKDCSILTPALLKYHQVRNHPGNFKILLRFWFSICLVHIVVTSEIDTLLPSSWKGFGTGSLSRYLRDWFRGVVRHAHHVPGLDGGRGQGEGRSTEDSWCWSWWWSVVVLSGSFFCDLQMLSVRCTYVCAIYFDILALGTW